MAGLSTYARRYAKARRPPTLQRRAAANAAKENRALKHPGPEQAPSADDLARHHEHAVAGIVQGLRIFRPARHVGFDHFEDEEVVLIDEAIVLQLALKLAWHSAMSGAPTSSAGSAVKWNFLNLSTEAPEQLPMR